MLHMLSVTYMLFSGNVYKFLGKEKHFFKVCLYCIFRHFAIKFVINLCHSMILCWLCFIYLLYSTNLSETCKCTESYKGVQIAYSQWCFSLNKYWGGRGRKPLFFIFALLEWCTCSSLCFVCLVVVVQSSVQVFPKIILYIW